MKLKLCTLIGIVVLATMSSTAFSVEDCPDGVCALPMSGSPTEGVYAVMSPVAPGSIKMIEQGPRLDTLNGKTIAIVGGSFMAYVTHPELKKLILKKYPKAKVLVLSEIGSAGPWPGPGVIRHEKDEFQQRLKDMKVDAVISGNGGCGLCTPKEMGSCIAAEYLGIPSVMIATPGFVTQARKAALTAGVPVPRVAEYPGAFAAHSREELIENTQKVLWPQIQDALTKPFTKEEKNASEDENNIPDDAIVFKGSLAEVNHLFAENGWTDGLPIIPPTKQRVDEFLKFTDMDPDEVIASLPVAYRNVTVRKVAINGVMSGCPAEFMPILIAFTKAMANGDFRRTLSSTHAWTPFCWINGPVARQLGIDCSQGEISTQKNAAIGRFINLAMLNMGGYYVKENRMGTFGYLMPWALAEDEKAALAIGWKPWHMQQGLELNDNALTAASSLCWGNNLAPASSDAQKIMEMMAWDAVEKEQFAVGSGTPFVYRTMLVTEYVARDLAAKFKSKDKLEDALIETARRPLLERAYANYWGNPGSAFDPNTYSVERHAQRIAQSEDASETSTPPWLEWSGLETVETVPVMVKGKTAIIITGDANRNKSMCVPGGGFATIKIELPANWDKLTEKLGYAPLKSFYLKSNLKPDPAPERSFRPGMRPQGGMQGQRRPGGGQFNPGMRPQGENMRPQGMRPQGGMQGQRRPGGGQFNPGMRPQGGNMRPQGMRPQGGMQGQRRPGGGQFNPGMRPQRQDE